MRNEFSRKVKAQAFERAQGRCELCTAKLSVGKFHYDHVVPAAVGGAATIENCQVACVACHEAKTTRLDVPQIAKSKRIRDKHTGVVTKRGRPMPGTKASGLRKRMDGTVERR